MDEMEHAAGELAAWECALREQREAEYDLLVEHRNRNHRRVQELRWTIDILRTRADLLLAEAVRIMCEHRNRLTADRLTDTRLRRLHVPLVAGTDPRTSAGA